MGTPSASVLTQRPHPARRPWGAPLYMRGAGWGRQRPSVVMETVPLLQTCCRQQAGVSRPITTAHLGRPGARRSWRCPERRLSAKATCVPASQSEAIFTQREEENTHEGSLHLVEDDPFEDQGRLGVGGVLVF